MKRDLYSEISTAYIRRMECEKDKPVCPLGSPYNKFTCFRKRECYIKKQ
jgi:hypothetical protein